MQILKNCRLVPELVEDFAEEFADIAIDGDCIAGIYAPGKAPAGQTIDIEGNTVLPGLLDLHMHVNFDTMDVYKIKGRNDMQYLVDGLAYAQDYLRNGYTFIRDCGVMHYQTVYIRKMIKSGLAIGPHMLISGPCNTPTTAGNSQFGDLYYEFNSSDEALEIVRRDLANGCDFVKYMVTGSVMNDGGEPGKMICSKEELAALTKAADSLGTYISCHCHGREGIMACIETGVGTIEHATYLDEECIDLIKEKHNRSAIIATVGVQYSMAKDLAHNTPAYMIEKGKKVLEHALTGLKMAYDAEIQVGWGSDLDKPTFDLVPGLEFMARSAAGLSPIQLLKMATIDSAKIIHMDEKCGSIKVGKWADLVVVEGKPDQDISAMYQLPLHVFVGGKQFC